MQKLHFPTLLFPFLLCLLLAACSPQPKGNNTSKVTTITGTAENAKAGAVVMTSDDQVYYIVGKSAWDDQHVKRLVEVSGVVSEEAYIPLAKRDDDGTVSQGTEGLQMVLRDATWKLLE